MAARSSVRFFPREHGAYVVMFVAWACGLSFSSAHILRETILLFAAFTLFFAQVPLKQLWRSIVLDNEIEEPVLRRASLLIGSGVIGMSSVLSAQRGAGLIIVAAIPLVIWSTFIHSRKKITLFLRTSVGFVLLCTLAPLTRMLTESISIAEALRLWLELSVFFVGAAITVNLRLNPGSLMFAVCFHLVAIIMAIIGESVGYYSLAGTIAVLVNSARFSWVACHLKGFCSLSLKKIGVQEVIMSTALLLIYLTI